MMIRGPSAFSNFRYLTFICRTLFVQALYAVIVMIYSVGKLLKEPGFFLSIIVFHRDDIGNNFLIFNFGKGYALFYAGICPLIKLVNNLEHTILTGKSHIEILRVKGILLKISSLYDSGYLQYNPLVIGQYILSYQFYNIHELVLFLKDSCLLYTSD